MCSCGEHSRSLPSTESLHPSLVSCSSVRSTAALATGLTSKQVLPTLTFSEAVLCLEMQAERDGLPESSTSWKTV